MMDKKYFARRVKKGWLPIFDKTLIESYNSIISSLIQTYPSQHFPGAHRYKSIENDNPEVLSTKLETILRPFQLIDIVDVRAIVIWGRPENSGVSTGIPWIYDHEAFPPFRKELLPNSLEFSPSVFTLKSALNDAGFGTESQLANVELFSSRVKGWFDEGVLILYSTLTNDTNDNKSYHDNLWTGFMESLLQRIYDFDNEIVYVCMGEDAQRYYTENSNFGRSRFLIFSRDPEN